MCCLKKAPPTDTTLPCTSPRTLARTSARVCRRQYTRSSNTADLARPARALAAVTNGFASPDGCTTGVAADTTRPRACDACVTRMLRTA